MKLGLVQMKVVDDKGTNIEKALEMIDRAAEGGAELVVLPEMFNCPYDNRFFGSYAEEGASGETLSALRRAAREKRLHIVAGSIPERDGTALFNTAHVVDPQGKILAKHRKMHLFDIDVKDGIRFFESETLSPGRSVTVFDTPACKVGVAVCYDMRFPELMRLMAMEGAELIVVPAAFNQVTGPAHWRLTARARALDNQVYFAAVSPALNREASYHAYGHTLFVNPWGVVVEELGEEEGLILCDWEKTLVEKTRDELPLLKHRRTDLYGIGFFAEEA